MSNEFDTSSSYKPVFIGYIYLNQIHTGLTFKHINDRKQLQEQIRIFYDYLSKNELNLDYLTSGEIFIYDHEKPGEMYFLLYDKSYLIKFED